MEQELTEELYDTYCHLYKEAQEQMRKATEKLQDPPIPPEGKIVAIHPNLLPGVKDWKKYFQLPEERVVVSPCHIQGWHIPCLDCSKVEGHHIPNYNAYTEEEVKELIEEREHRIEDWHTRYIRRKQHHIE